MGCALFGAITGACRRAGHRPIPWLAETSGGYRFRMSKKLTDETIAAVGKVSEALEYVERARGHLYSFHQLMGHADLLLGDCLLYTSPSPRDRS